MPLHARGQAGLCAGAGAGDGVAQRLCRHRTGWWTAASGGTQVIDGSRNVQASKTGWTNGSKQWILTNASNTANTNRLYAQFTPNPYTITYKDCGGGDFSGTHSNGYPTQYTYGTGATLDSPTKSGYTFGVTSVSNTDSGNKTFYAKWIQNPATPTISGGATKVYNYQDTTLTCSTTTTYGTGLTKYYSFGYATADGGTPGNWTTASTTNTLLIGKAAYRGTRYYSCRVYVSDGSNNTSTSTSLANADTEMTLVNARIDFDATTNGGTISGTTPLYVPYGQTNIYTGRTNTTAGTIPTATKANHTFTGWWTAASGGTQVNIFSS